MSYGTRKAIAGTMKGCDGAAAGVAEAIQKFDACQSAADVRSVLDWAKQRGGWFLRTGDDDRKMRAAFDRALVRVSGG